MKMLRTLAAVLASLTTLASALTATSLFPTPGSTGLCLDAPLRLNLDVRPVMGWHGAIRIRNLATNTVVKIWDVSTNPGDPMTADVSPTWPWKDSVGYTQRNVWSIILDSVPGNLAEIRVPQHLLLPNTKYQVELDSGVLKGSDNSTFKGIAAGAWTFTTGATPTSKSTVIVAADNSGDVCSIEKGLELVPSSSKTPVQVLVRPGYYREMIAAKNKSNLQLYGAGNTQTFIRYFNSNNLNDNGSSYRNVVMLGGNQISIRALSLVNTVNVAGAQAEALYIQGDSNIVADVFLHSYQDTWLNTGGRVYVQDATIEGSVDFIWGYSPVFFKRCSLVLNRTGGVIVQPRNDSLHHGYVFDSCSISAKTTGYTGCHFARDAGASYSYGEVMYLHTKIISGSFFDAAPWTINSTTDSANLRFCEYQSTDASGTLLTITGTQRTRLQCRADSATAHAQPSFVLSGWTPVVPSLASVLALTATSSSSTASSSSAVSSSVIASSSSVKASSSSTAVSSSTVASSSSAVTASTLTLNNPLAYDLIRNREGFELQGTKGSEELTIMDVHGQQLQHWQASPGNTAWQVPDAWQNGIYFLKMSAGNSSRNWVLTIFR